MYSLGIIGGGRAAWAYGSTWTRLGWPLHGVSLRRASTSPIDRLLGIPRMEIDELVAAVDVLLVAVSDAVLEDLIRSLPETNAVIVHPSGALPALRGGFALHPLRSLPPPGEPSDLRGTLLVFDGAYRQIAVDFSRACGARMTEISAAAKPLYHAAAVFGANHVAAILDIAANLFAKAGVAATSADITALARSAIANWEQHRDTRRFTGPAARGDVAVLDSHRAALAADPELQRLYDVLSEWIVRHGERP